MRKGTLRSLACAPKRKVERRDALYAGTRTRATTLPAPSPAPSPSPKRSAAPLTRPQSPRSLTLRWCRGQQRRRRSSGQRRPLLLHSTVLLLPSDVKFQSRSCCGVLPPPALALPPCPAISTG